MNINGIGNSSQALWNQPTAFNSFPQPNVFAQMGGMQFPSASKKSAQSLANSLMGYGGGLFGSSFMPINNPFMGGNYSGNSAWQYSGLNSANNQVAILQLLQRFLDQNGFFSNGGGSKKPNDNPSPSPKPKQTEPNISGKGSISGTSFKSGDGESYALNVKPGKVYNLLSDTGVGLNGRYGMIDNGSGSQLGLTDIALHVNGSTVTFDDDGYLEVNGKKYSKSNDANGAVKRNSNGSYTINTGEYELTLSKDSAVGIKVGIKGTNILKDGVAPEGLWGASFDGEKESTRDIQRNIRETNYEIERLEQFDYEDNNNIGKSVKTSDEDGEEELKDNLKDWQKREGYIDTATGGISLGNMTATADGAAFTSIIDKLKAGKIYNLFSDEGIQMGGKFGTQPVSGKNYPTEFGFYVDGQQITATRSGYQVSLKVGGVEVTDANLASFAPMITKDSNGRYTISGGADGETHKFTIGIDGASGSPSDALQLSYGGTNLGTNSTRASGLLAEMIGTRTTNAADGFDNNLAGYIRNAFGLQTSLQDVNIADALAGYELSGYSDTEGGFSNYEGG